ncbi:MAG: glycerophosphodiester phosphodiesterase family protein [Pseudomonadota bacterium]
MKPASPTPDFPPRVVAHRGASGTAPENTLAAFRAAAALGARWLEFDVTLLGDGTPVIHHDATLDRTTNKTGPLSALKVSDLAEIDAGARFDARFAGEPLPTLEETLELLCAEQLHANIELKPHGAPGNTARAVVGLLGSRPRAPAHVTISSFDHDALAVVRSLTPTLPIALLYEKLSHGWQEKAASLGAEAVHLAAANTQGAAVEAAHAAGLSLRCYTVNDPAEAARLAACKVDAIFTDYPERFLDDPYWGASAAMG